MRRRKLPPLSLDAVLAKYPSHRQSLLGKLDSCALSTLFELEGVSYTNGAQARGILFHRFAAEVLATLRRTGERRIPTEEAMVILREVERQHGIPDEDVVTVPARERRMLRILALKFSRFEFNASRIIDVEGQLSAEVSYTTEQGENVTRTVTGRPDAMIAAPPDGIIVLDHKTAPSAPAEGKQKDDHGDPLHVSVEGYFQQRIYAFLIMSNFPPVRKVMLREFYPLPEEVREATVSREAMEHLTSEVTMLVEYLDRALAGGSESALWSPSPGRWCSYCRRPGACPIEAEARAAEGGITSHAQAERIAAEVAVADRVRTAGLAAMKGYHDETARPIPLRDGKARYEWRWTKDSGGKRRFKLTTPEKKTTTAEVVDGA